MLSDYVVERILKCLDRWKGPFFSLGGFIILIQALLGQHTSMLLSFFRILVKVAELIEVVMREGWESPYEIM